MTVRQIIKAAPAIIIITTSAATINELICILYSLTFAIDMQRVAKEHV